MKENSVQAKSHLENQIKQLQNKENSAQDNNVTKNQRELKENSAQDTSVTNNQLEIKENNVQDTNLTDTKRSQRKQCARH